LQLQLSLVLRRLAQSLEARKRPPSAEAKCPRCRTWNFKSIWPSKESAEEFCLHSGDEGLHAYPCPHVYGWHIGRHAIPVHDERRQLAAENGFGSVRWHTFRHTYRTLLSGADTPIDVQQKLLRHAQISTTRQYGGPPMENQRRANSKVVRKLLFRESAG